MTAVTMGSGFALELALSGGGDVPGGSAGSNSAAGELPAALPTVSQPSGLADSAADVISDDAVLARGGVQEIPSGTFSAGVGSTEEAAGAGVKNNQIQTSTARAVREAGGTVQYAPEPAYPGGPTNYRHVNVTGGQSTFSKPKPNTAAKNLRPPSPPKPTSQTPTGSNP